MDPVVGIDIGGTAIKAGRLGPQGEPQPAAARPTLIENGAADLCDRLADWARELGARAPLGIGVPGVFAPGTRTLVESPNLPALEGCDLRLEVAQRLGWAPECIAIDNDANVAALGEARLGAGRNAGDLAMVTLGTGVGGGFVFGGQIFRGGLGQGAEVGHLFVHDRERCDEPCGCGRWGCLESFASATAAMRRARRAGLTDDLSALCAAAREAPGPARELLVAIGEDLGRGLAQVLVLLDPPTFVIGGGFGAALDTLLPGIRAGIAERDFAQRHPQIVAATLGADAGWIGAACLAQSEGVHAN